jgi:hypothetical protein
MLAGLAAVCFGVYNAGRYLLRRHRQRMMARFAPELLRFERVDPMVAQVIIVQRQRLEAGADLVSRMLEDMSVLIPSEYATPLQEWVESNRKANK